MRLSTWLMSGTVIATADGLALGRLGDHEPVAVEDELQLGGVLVQVAPCEYGTKPQFSLHAAL